jgi:hypothetical protein
MELAEALEDRKINREGVKVSASCCPHVSVSTDGQHAGERDITESSLCNF